jgi:GNAT superfamily N-acetyltransferase
MDVIVRAVTSDDELALFDLTSRFPTPTPCTLEVFRAILQSKLADSRSAIFVGELGTRLHRIDGAHGSLVGYVSGSTRDAFYAAGATAWVDEILVVPDERGAGLGARLMNAFEAWAARQRCTHVALATRSAGPFYERLGYASRAEYFKKYLE